MMVCFLIIGMTCNLKEQKFSIGVVEIDKVKTTDLIQN